MNEERYDGERGTTTAKAVGVQRMVRWSAWLPIVGLITGPGWWICQKIEPDPGLVGLHAIYHGLWLGALIGLYAR